MIYEPREDSELLRKEVAKYAKGIVLDMGTGSGIQALEAAKKSNVKKVIAVDIQKDVIEHCKKNIKNKKITFVESDLLGIFSKANKKESIEKNSNIFNFKKQKNKQNKKISKTQKRITHNKALSKEPNGPKFDTIIFNPPYLPEDVRLKDITIDGGKKGYEVIEKFLSQAKNFLKKQGKIILLFSSLTKKRKVEDIIKRNNFKFKQLTKLKIFFEELYVYIIQNGYKKKLY